MKVQVLAVTMNQEDYSLLEKMNIQTDAIIGNQCNRNKIEEFTYRDRRIKWISLKEKGVGLNRNTILMRATEDIVLFADDDVVYYDDYEKTIVDYYSLNPEADIVIFNFKMRRGETAFKDRVTSEGRVGRKKAAKYGTYCITAKREKLRFANVYFHLDFGGGTKYSCGEDSAFLQECLNKGLRIYATKATIGKLDHGQSTWFKGYSDKFFYDKGILYYKMYPKLCPYIAFYHCLKHKELYREYGWKNAFIQMMRGIKEISKN